MVYWLFRSVVQSREASVDLYTMDTLEMTNPKTHRDKYYTGIVLYSVYTSQTFWTLRCVYQLRRVLPHRQSSIMHYTQYHEVRQNTTSVGSPGLPYRVMLRLRLSPQFSVPPPPSWEYTAVFVQPAGCSSCQTETDVIKFSTYWNRCHLNGDVISTNQSYSTFLELVGWRDRKCFLGKWGMLI